MWTTKWCNCTRGCYDNLDVIDFKDDNHDGNATLSELTSINNDDNSFFLDLKVKNNFLTNCAVEFGHPAFVCFKNGQRAICNQIPETLRP